MPHLGPHAFHIHAADAATRHACKPTSLRLEPSTPHTLFHTPGRLGPRELYGDSQYGLLARLREFEAWAQQQRSFQFFQASVLFMYEGEAETMQQAKARVAFVDFAHTFQTVDGARDENLVASLASLVKILEQVVATAG